MVSPIGQDITAYASRAHLQRARFSLTPIQAILSSFLLAIGVFLQGFTVRVALANTLIIFVFITVFGLWLCHRTRVKLGDPELKILGTFWLLKVGITLFLLYVGWIPYLDPATSPAWGYDPQRFYQDAWDLVTDGWNPRAGSNYQGAIFYYGGIFFLFGRNPVIPALINAFVTLIGTLFLIRCLYSFVPERATKDWTICGLLLVPEVLWYDVMTSRETLMAALILVAALGAGRYLVGVKKFRRASTLLLPGTALFAILAVRTSMAIPVIASIGVMALVLRSHHKIGVLVKFLLVALGIAVISVGPLIQSYLGGSDIEYLAALENAQSFETNVAAQAEWSDNSIGLLIAPNNAWQSLLYLPPRMVLYLAAPLPNIDVSLTELIDGNWSAWQRLMTLPTAAMMLLGFPYAVAGAAQAWRRRGRQPEPLVLHITFWMIFVAVAGGNIIIHERYRLMFTLLLFASMWLGYRRCSRMEVKFWAFPWYALLVGGGVFYLGYKLLG